MLLSKRASILVPSPTLKMSARAGELKSQGHPVINLTVGEPDWETFAAAKTAGKLAIDNNFTRYTPASGTPDLKAKVAAFISEEFKVSFKSENIAIGPGAKFLLYSTFQMLLDEGDEVLIPSPFWVSYPTMIDLCQAKAKIISTKKETRFKVTPDQIKEAITNKTKALLLCSPNNPSGVAYTKDELKAIANVLLQYPKLIIISDDIYNRLYFGEEAVAPHLLHVCPELKDRLITVGGASKSFAMTGWRIGWMGAPKELIKKVSDYLSQTTSNPSSISQKALLSVLDNFDQELSNSKKTLIARSLELDKSLNEYGIPFLKPDGAFYYFIDISSAFGKKANEGKLIQSSLDFAEALLNQKFVATVAGSDFGTEGWVRISFAVSPADLKEGVTRIHDFLKALHP